jgi:hypothetical protein
MKLDINPLSSCRPKQPPTGLKERVLEAASHATPDAEQAYPLFGKTEWGLLAATLILFAIFVASVYPGRTQPPPLHGTHINLSHSYLQTVKEIGIPLESFCSISKERPNNQQLLEEIGG